MMNQIDEESKNQGKIEELSQSRDLLDQILNGMYERLMVIDQDFVIKDVNNYFLDHYKFKRKEVIGHHCYEITHQLNHPCFEDEHDCPVKTVFKTAKPVNMEHIHFDHKGNKIIEEINSFPIFDKDGNVELTVELLYDITERKHSEHALRESEDRYRTISELISDFVYAIRVDPDGTNIAEWSTETLHRVIGMNHAELLEHGGWKEIIHPDDLSIVIQRQQDLASGKSDVSEYRVVTKSGEIRWVRDYAYPIWDNTQKRIVNIYGAAQDITERKRAEEALRKSKERFEDIVNLLPEAVFEIDLDGNFTYANQRAFELSGYTQKDINKGLNAMQLIIPKDRKRAKENIRRVYNGEKLGINEYILTRKNGTTFPALIHSAVNLHDGKPQGLRGIIIDISDRKQAEEALRESEERFRSIAEGSFDIIFMLSPEQKFTYISPAVERIMGYSPELLTGKSIKNFILKSEVFKLKNLQEQLSHARFIEGLEIGGQSKNGHILYLEVNINPIYKNNKLFGYQGVARDITERKHAEEEMKKRLMKFKLEEGDTYLAKERTPTLVIEAYKELIKIGYNGIIISRTPEKDFNNFENDDIKFYWLAEKTTTNSILPNLNRIEEIIEDLPNRNIILIDRLDYLFSKHGFKKMLRLVHHLKDLAIIKNFIILLSIDPSTLSVQELRLLEKETSEIETIRRTELPQHLIDILKFIYHQNTMGSKPSYTEIGDILSLSKPTVRKRVRSLISGGFINENSRGRSKVLDLNERGKNIFQK